MKISNRPISIAIPRDPKPQIDGTPSSQPIDERQPRLVRITSSRQFKSPNKTPRHWLNIPLSRLRWQNPVDSKHVDLIIRSIATISRLWQHKIYL